MRAIKGRMEGNVIHLSEEVSGIQDKEVIVLVPTSPNEPNLDLMLYAGIWSDMPEQDWHALEQVLQEGIQFGDECP